MRKPIHIYISEVSSNSKDLIEKSESIFEVFIESKNLIKLEIAKTNISLSDIQSISRILKNKTTPLRELSLENLKIDTFMINELKMVLKRV